MTNLSANKYALQAWQLDDLFPALPSAEVQKAFAELESLTTTFETFRPELNDDISPTDFHAILANYEKIARQLGRLWGYARLSFAADTQDQQAQSFLAQVNQLKAETSNRTLFFELWWKNAPEELLRRLLPAAGDYQYWLEKLRLQIPFTLSEPEERVINLKNVNGRAAFVQLYESITNRYNFTFSVDGQVKTLTRGEIRTYFHAPDPAQRQAAYQELNRVYGHDAPILGQIFQALARDWRSENLALRHFSSPIAAWNLQNNIPDEVVDTLLSVIRANRYLFQRYFQLKAKWLGMDKLQRYDIYAPVVQAEENYAFGKAAALVLHSFHEFDPHIAELAQRVFDENHFDGQIRAGKNSGAFCATPVPDLTPWILQNFTGQLSDVMTMAHELGHAIHTMLSAHHPQLTHHAALPLAETASIFAELLVSDHLLAQDPAPEQQRALAFDRLDDSFATILRQGYFALFERDAYKAIQDGASVNDLSALYLENLAEQFGDAVTIPSDFQHEWLAIPHFYRWPFYVYAYAFGHLLVLALYEQYQAEGEPFKARYLDILAAGGSAAPVAILQKAGIDIFKAEFWQTGFDVLAKQLDQLENLAGRPTLAGK
jgi:oligoendopeptidase F